MSHGTHMNAPCMARTSVLRGGCQHRYNVCGRRYQSNLHHTLCLVTQCPILLFLQQFPHMSRPHFFRRKLGQPRKTHCFLGPPIHPTPTPPPATPVPAFTPNPHAPPVTRSLSADGNTIVEVTGARGVLPSPSLSHC